MDARTVIRLLWELYVTNVAERAEQREKRRFGHLCVEAAHIQRLGHRGGTPCTLR